MNAPSRFELFVLADGESKLTVTEDTKLSNAITLSLLKEDHTLANLLRSQLLLQPSTLFCGYQVPHPLEPVVVLKLQTDGSLTPIQSVLEACSGLIRTLVRLKKEVGFAGERAEMMRDGEGDGEGGFGMGMGEGDGGFAY